MGAGTAIAAVLVILALSCVAPAKQQAVPLPAPNRQATIEASGPSLAVEARVKFSVLGSGDQFLYATVTRDEQPVKGAVVGVTVWYQSVSRTLPRAVTGADGTAVIDWSVGRPSGGFTLIEVTATHQGETARTTTGFYPR